MDIYTELLTKQEEECLSEFRVPREGMFGVVTVKSGFVAVEISESVTEVLQKTVSTRT